MTLQGGIDPFAVIRATWPAARTARLGPWRINEAPGAGSRVTAATLAEGSATAADVDRAVAAMTALGQTPLFMVQGNADHALDTLLADLGYIEKDATTLYAIDSARIAKAPPPLTCFEVWPPLAVQEDIWQDGGIGPARLAVMARAGDPKTTIFARIDDRPAGTGFVAIHDGIAMLHALEVLESHRRKGLARHMMGAAAHWAAGHGAQTFTLLVTRANLPANALYTSLGFVAVGQYHYRIRPEAA